MSKSKRYTTKNIVKLYCKTPNGSETDSESEYSEDHAEYVIKKLTNEKTNTVNTHIHQVFNINDTDILVIADAENNYWYKAKDVAILLEYKNTAGAVKRHVSKEYRKSLADIGCRTTTPLKIDSQTTFVDDSGLFQLVARSSKLEAIALWRKITKEILPTIFRTGTYSLQPTGIQIEELTKNFYDDNTIMSYKNRNAIYLAYIGKYNGVHILKFGKTKDFINIRENQHAKTYKIFNVLKIWETLACDHAEDNIKTEFKNTKLLVKINSKKLNMNCQERVNSELIRIDEIKNLQYIINKIDHIIDTTILPKEQKYIDQIKDLTYENKILKTEVSSKNDLVESLRETISILKEDR